MKKLPTDLEILNAIYERYYETFARYVEGDKCRGTKNYVPISTQEIANDLVVDGDIVFGRLYYHLEKKHGYRQEDGCMVYLFALRIGKDINCVNFPLLASVLADLRDQAKKHKTVTQIASLSLIISIIAIVISLIASG